MPLKYSDMADEVRSRLQMLDLRRDSGITDAQLTEMNDRRLELMAAGYPEAIARMFSACEVQMGARITDLPEIQ